MFSDVCKAVAFSDSRLYLVQGSPASGRRCDFVLGILAEVASEAPEDQRPHRFRSWDWFEKMRLEWSRMNRFSRLDTWCDTDGWMGVDGMGWIDRSIDWWIKNYSNFMGRVPLTKPPVIVPVSIDLASFCIPGVEEDGAAPAEICNLVHLETLDTIPPSPVLGAMAQHIKQFACNCITA